MTIMNAPTLAFGSVVCSIKDAITELSQPVNKKTNDPVDILAIVTDYHHKASVATPCLRIVDRSSGAYISIRENEQISINIGDVIRFNGIGLKAERFRFGTFTTETDPTPTPFGLPHFHYPWDKPQEGPSWFRLGHVQIGSGQLIQRPREETIPRSMKTDHTSLDSLVAWYVASTHFTARTKLLFSPQLPHRRRSLEEMLSCVGTTGEIVVYVVELVEPSSDGPCAVVPNTFSNKQQARRSSTSAIVAPMAYAILSASNPLTSGNKHVATLWDPQKRFLAQLGQARDSQCRILITHVRSQQANHPPPPPSAAAAASRRYRRRAGSIRVTDDIVLCVTQASRMTLLDDHGLADETTRETTMMLTTETQMSCATATGKPIVHWNACVVDIIIHRNNSIGHRVAKLDHHDSILSPDHHDNIPNLVIKSLQCGDTETLSCFRLVLVGKEDLERIEVRANHSVLLRLCGGPITSSSLLQHQRMEHVPCSLAECFLGVILRDGAVLRWVLERESIGWIATDVSLHTIPSSSSSWLETNNKKRKTESQYDSNNKQRRHESIL